MIDHYAIMTGRTPAHCVICGKINTRNPHYASFYDCRYLTTDKGKLCPVCDRCGKRLDKDYVDSLYGGKSC